MHDDKVYTKWLAKDPFKESHGYERYQIQCWAMLLFAT